MRRAIRYLAIAIPTALVAASVALTGAEPATGGAGQPRAGEEAPQSAADPATVQSALAAAASATSQVKRALAARVARIRPGYTVALRTRPNGPIAVRLGDSTEFGSARRLGVVRRQGRWLGVTTAALPNGRLGWIDSRAGAVSIERTRWSIRADVSRRQIVLRRDGQPVRRLTVAVGRAGSPTPTGRFAVTDKLDGGRFGPYYGCCILAISATQPNTPPGWTGGNRMAIHGTSDPGSVGAAASAGCLRAHDADLRFLMERVPVGTPVVIKP